MVRKKSTDVDSVMVEFEGEAEVALDVPAEVELPEGYDPEVDYDEQEADEGRLTVAVDDGETVILDAPDAVMFGLIGTMDDGASRTLGSITGATRAKAAHIVAEAERRTGIDVQTLWGKGSSSEHATGRAVDFMVTGSGQWLGGSRTAAERLGDAIADVAWELRDAYDLGWIIWRQRIRSTSPGKTGHWTPMLDRGSITQNHYDHPHIYWRSDKLVQPAAATDAPATVAPTPAPVAPSVPQLSVSNLAEAMRRDVPAKNGTYSSYKNQVGVLQAMLVEMGFLRAAGLDWGHYGSATVYAVKAAQRAFGITRNPDGWFGPMELNEALRRTGKTSKYVVVG